MGGEGEDIGIAFEAWLRGSADRPEGVSMKERACAHYRQGGQGAPVGGRVYLGALQRQRGPAAERVARAVEPFFWSDAARVIVWLCRECAAEVGLEEGDAHAA